MEKTYFRSKKRSKAQLVGAAHGMYHKKCMNGVASSFTFDAMWYYPL